MASLNPADPQVQNHIQEGLRWLNMKSNSLQPFTLDAVHSVVQEPHGDLTVECNLKMFGNDHPFRLVLEPGVNGPEFLKDHKQLN